MINYYSIIESSLFSEEFAKIGYRGEEIRIVKHNNLFWIETNIDCNRGMFCKKSEIENVMEIAKRTIDRKLKP